MSETLWIFVTSVNPQGANPVVHGSSKYLFVNQSGLEENSDSFQNLFIEIERELVNEAKSINILFHDRHLGYDLSSSSNPWGRILDDADMLSPLPGGNYPYEDISYFNELKVDWEQLGKSIDVFFIFRHEADSYCYKFINNIKEENFAHTFHHYIKKKRDKITTEKLIRVLIPIAIDVQGISEVTEESKEDYIAEVFDAYNNDNQEFIKNIKDILKEMPNEEGRIDIDYFENVLNDLESRNKEKFLNCCNKKNIREFFPNKVREVTDKLILQKKMNI
jgi:hypothetical protein